MKQTTLALLGATFFWACSEAEVTDAPPLAAAQADVFGMAPEGADRKDIGAMTEEERRAYGDAMIRMRMDLERAVSAPGGWQEADRQTRLHLEQYPELADYLVQQTAGSMMLNAHLSDKTVDADKAEAIGFYTDLLVRSGSPNAPLIERALISLEGHWDEDQLAASAATASASAERYVVSRTECEGCSGADALARLSIAPPADVRVRQIAESMTRLQAR